MNERCSSSKTSEGESGIPDLRTSQAAIPYNPRARRCCPRRHLLCSYSISPTDGSNVIAARRDMNRRVETQTRSGRSKDQKRRSAACEVSASINKGWSYQSEETQISGVLNHEHRSTRPLAMPENDLPSGTSKSFVSAGGGVETGCGQIATFLTSNE